MGLNGLPADYNFQRQSEVIEAEVLNEDFYGSDITRRKSPRQIVLEHVKNLNKDQRKAFYTICDAVTGKSDQKLFFVEGAGGCGKNSIKLSFLKGRCKLYHF